MMQPLKIGKYVEIYLSSFVLLFFALLFDFANKLFVTYILVLIHELAHVGTAMFLKVQVQKIEVMPFGITMRLSNTNIRKPSHEAIIAIAGPICNIILAMLALFLNSRNFIDADTTNYLVITNCAIALINIVPALPLDGGRIMKALLTEHWGYVKAFNFTIIITKVVVGFLLGFGIFVLIYTKFNFSILLIGSFLIVNAYQEQRGSKLIIMKELLYSREKLTNNGFERTDCISIMETEPARKALKLMGYNRYYIIHVVDKNMNIIKTLTETQLIQSLIDKGVRVKANELT